MSIRLLLASLWMPRSAAMKEIDEIERRTNEALDFLLRSHSITMDMSEDHRTSNDLSDKRKRMALSHKRRVDALIHGLGEEKAVELGREALHQVGHDLGKEAKERLRVSDSKRDLIRAARVMYRILGIDFQVQSVNGRPSLVVHRCALSENYSRTTCLLLSAVDEGVVSGLSEGASMRFTRRITDDSQWCVAEIAMEGER